MLIKALSDMRKELEPEEVEFRVMTDSSIIKLEATIDKNFDKLELFLDADESSDFFRQLTDLFITNRRKNISPIVGKVSKSS